MPALDFKEIASPAAGPDRDQFELFARETLQVAGFRIIAHPDRGADGGRDLIVEELREGPGGATRVRWLVSCKHKAHSGSSVMPGDEQNIRDRLATHRCNGFIAFYSTIPSSGLAATLEALAPAFEYLQLDREAVERTLLATPAGRTVATRFMPNSYAAWRHASRAVIVAAAPDPHRSNTRFFLREPHDTLAGARAEAKQRGIPIFAIIYDPGHPTHSRIEHSLGHFMDYQTTKLLVDQHFVAMVGKSTDPDLAALVPDHDPLEKCLWVVLAGDGTVMRREGVYANADEGMKRVRSVIGEVTA